MARAASDRSASTVGTFRSALQPNGICSGLWCLPAKLVVEATGRGAERERITLSPARQGIRRIVPGDTRRLAGDGRLRGVQVAVIREYGGERRRAGDVTFGGTDRRYVPLTSAIAAKADSACLDRALHERTSGSALGRLALMAQHPASFEQRQVPLRPTVGRQRYLRRRRRRRLQCRCLLRTRRFRSPRQFERRRRRARHGGASESPARQFTLETCHLSTQLVRAIAVSRQAGGLAGTEIPRHRPQIGRQRQPTSGQQRDTDGDDERQEGQPKRNRQA